MTCCSFVLYLAVNTFFILLISPFFMGIVKTVKARCQGRKGPGVMQQYYNLLKLIRKESVYSSNSSAVMRMTPYINISVMLTASLCVPLAFSPGQSFGMGNVILFLYLLAFARFFMSLAGLDAGSAFGGMGSSREMSISAIVEPITIIVFAALAFSTQTTDIHWMFSRMAQETSILNPSLILISIPLFIVLITETSRIPVDNPETHLELTMIHEAMTLEYSGKDLALMELSHAVKQTMLMAIMINILVPWGYAVEPTWFSVAVALLAFLVKGAALSAVIGLFESSTAKMRLFSLPNLFMMAYFLATLTILVEVFK